jgi:predicted nucleotidyltransferase
MQRNEILKILHEHRADLEKHGVKSLALFGSAVREEMTPRSDVDLLVEFAQPVGLFEFLRLNFYLEELLGRRIDLVTPDALKSQLRERILAEAIYAA